MSTVWHFGPVIGREASSISPNSVWNRHNPSQTGSSPRKVHSNDTLDRQQQKGRNMSKFKSMPKFGWFVSGVVVTVLLIPTTAAASGVLKFVGIEGTSGQKANVTASGQLLTNGEIQGTSGSQADVTGANQVLSTEATPPNLYEPHSVDVLEDGGTQVIAAPPSTPTGSSALIIDSLHISVYLIGSPGAGTLFTFDVETGSCSGTRVGPYFQQVIPGTIGEIDIPLDPGVRVPAGDSLCAVSEHFLGGAISASGEVVPSSSVPSP